MVSFESDSLSPGGSCLWSWLVHWLKAGHYLCHWSPPLWDAHGSCCWWRSTVAIFHSTLCSSSPRQPCYLFLNLLKMQRLLPTGVGYTTGPQTAGAWEGMCFVKHFVPLQMVLYEIYIRFDWSIHLSTKCLFWGLDFGDVKKGRHVGSNICLTWEASIPQSSLCFLKWVVIAFLTQCQDCQTMSTLHYITSPQGC